MIPNSSNPAAQHESAIQALMEQTELPRETIAEVYQAELAALQEGVRITQFLSLIVSRRVVKSLRERGQAH